MPIIADHNHDGAGNVVATIEEERRREAFADILSALLASVVDSLKFAEAKNAALLTFAAAWTFASINMLLGGRAAGGIVGAAFWLMLVLFAAVAVVAVVSFLPKRNLRAINRDPTQSQNLLYFEHIAEFDTAGFLKRVRDRYLAQNDQSVTDQYLEDLVVQISANSKITRRKLIMFNVGAVLVLIALSVLALAVVSAAINSASAGALLWG
jgi:hypothetical protein